MTTEETVIPEIGEVYVHFKTGGRYVVTKLPIDARLNDGRVCVDYMSLYDSEKYPRGTEFNKSLEEFVGFVVLEDGTQVKRFVRVLEDSQ